MSGYQGNDDGARAVALRARNKRTGLILATVVVVFFIGMLVKYTLLR